MPQSKSFERAVFDGDIIGPTGTVTDDNGIPINAGDQNFRTADESYYHLNDGRAVRVHEDGYWIGHVIDFQFPAGAEIDS